MNIGDIYPQIMIVTFILVIIFPCWKPKLKIFKPFSCSICVNPNHRLKYTFIEFKCHFSQKRQKKASIESFSQSKHINKSIFTWKTFSFSTARYWNFISFPFVCELSLFLCSCEAFHLNTKLLFVSYRQTDKRKLFLK